MHWRWSSASTEPGTFGFQRGVPCAAAGLPMVPENQDVSLRITAGNQFIYTARAYDVGMEEWQVFCHHGAGYLVSVGQPMKDARDFKGVVAMPYMSTDSSGVSFADAQGKTIDGGDSWAVFYWHLRYFLEGPYSPAPTERIVIHDLAAIEAE
jgi:hypothetical protein